MSEAKGIASAGVVIMVLLFLTVLVAPRATPTASAPNSLPGMDMSAQATTAASVPAATPSAPHATSPLLQPDGSKTTLFLRRH